MTASNAFDIKFRLWLFLFMLLFLIMLAPVGANIPLLVFVAVSQPPFPSLKPVTKHSISGINKQDQTADSIGVHCLCSMLQMWMESSEQFTSRFLERRLPGWLPYWDNAAPPCKSLHGSCFPARANSPFTHRILPRIATGVARRGVAWRVEDSGCSAQSHEPSHDTHSI